MSKGLGVKHHEAVVYTDSSWCPMLNIAVYGYLILYCGGNIIFTDVIPTSKNSLSEEKAIIVGLQRAFMLKSVKKIILNTDFKNVVDAVNLNKTKPLLEETKDTIEMITDYGIDLSFNWVKGHSNNEYNTKIDKECRKKLRELTTRLRI